MFRSRLFERGRRPFRYPYTRTTATAVNLVSPLFVKRRVHLHLCPSINIGQTAAFSAVHRPQAIQWYRCPNELIDRSIDQSTNPCIPFRPATDHCNKNRIRSYGRFSFTAYRSQATISAAQLGKSAAGLARPSPLKTLEEGVPRAVALAKLEQARNTNP